VGALQPLQGYAEIPGSGSNICVAEQNLDGAEVGAGIQHVSGASMEEQVRMDRALEAGP